MLGLISETKSYATKKFLKEEKVMFAMAKIMEMTKEEQNQTALYLFNDILILC